ncbi:hypothetical protein GCM10009754_57580 [Amycolatopsis minnesotensis]|uniref:SDR family oxidoreductase n=1 Tax=Amycolatopsis minnesotensis TaxID=337894 RepID=A0ABP5D7N2_9PSEU
MRFRVPTTLSGFNASWDDVPGTAVEKTIHWPESGSCNASQGGRPGAARPDRAGGVPPRRGGRHRFAGKTRPAAGAVAVAGGGVGEEPHRDGALPDGKGREVGGQRSSRSEIPGRAARTGPGGASGTSLTLSYANTLRDEGIRVNALSPSAEQGGAHIAGQATLATGGPACSTAKRAVCTSGDTRKPPRERARGGSA